jgi:hypothetical protein
MQRGPTGCVCLIVCDLENSTMRRPRPKLCCCATEKKIISGEIKDKLISIYAMKDMSRPYIIHRRRFNYSDYTGALQTRTNVSEHFMCAV